MKSNPTFEYETIIIKEENDIATYCDIPFDVFEFFGKKRVKILAIFDNRVHYRGLLTPYNGKYFLMMNKEIRLDVGKKPGDRVHIIIKEDLEERKVEIPIEFETTMKENGVFPFFEKLAYTCQKEYIVWITGAKKIETRDARFIKAIEMLKLGKKNP